ncbi:MAG: hypothetical protein AAGN82_04365 [Myxococcota bacterium]
MTSPVGTPPAAVDRGDAVGAWLTMSIPALVAVGRASSSVQWASDVAVVRDAGRSAVGFGGAVSTAATQAAMLLPLGTISFRHALVSVVGLAAAAGAMRRVACHLLAPSGLPPRLAALVASLAAVMAALSPTWQLASTTGGGDAVALALTWWGLSLAMERTAVGTRSLTPEASRGWLGLSAVVGLALAQDVVSSLMLVGAVLAASFVAGKVPPWRLWPALVLVPVGVFAMGVAPVALRAFVTRGMSDLGAIISGLPALPQRGAAGEHAAAVLAWNAEVGTLSIGLAVVGLVAGGRRPRCRAALMALVVFIVADLGLALAGAPVPGARLAWRGHALGGLCLAAAVGLAEAIAFIRRLEVPFARAAVALGVVGFMVLAAVTHEEAAYRADRNEHRAAEVWTDSALGALPPRAALLVRSPALTWRLWAAQVVSERRPDVLVIPAPLLRQGAVVPHLVPREPAVARLIRDFALHGAASEYGLSVLSDARPLFVELDPGWAPRIVDHTRVEGAWLRFASQRLGRSDRDLDAHVLHSEGPVGAALVDLDVPDVVGAEVVARTLKEHVTALALVGMSQDTPPLIDGVERLVPRDPFVVAARLRVGHAARRREHRRSLELRDLLRF